MGTNSPPNFVERPILYFLDLDIYCLSNLWDPPRVVDNTLLYRHVSPEHKVLGRYSESEPPHFPNLPKSPIYDRGGGSVSEYSLEIRSYILSDDQYYYESISTSTVFPIYGTPLGLCASTYYVDISSSFFQRINESQVIAFSVGIPIQKPDFRVGHFSNILMK